MSGDFTASTDSGGLHPQASLGGTASATATRPVAERGPRVVHETWWRRRSTWRWRRHTTFLALGTIVLGLGVALAPTLLLAFLPKYVDILLRKQIGHRLAVGKLDLDVWRLHLTAHDASLAPARGGPPVITCERVDVEIDPSKLLHGIWLESVELRNVTAHVVRKADGTLDVVSTILDARRRLTPGGDDKLLPLHLGIGHASPVSIAFHDETTGESHQLKCEVQCLGLGNVRIAGEEETTAPGRFLFEASGLPLVKKIEVMGEANLAGPEPQARLSARVDALDLETLARSIPGARASGRRLDAQLDARVGQRFSDSDDEATTRVEVGPVFVHVDGQPSVLLESARAVIETSEAHGPFLREVEVTRPEVALERLADGALSVAGLVPVQPAAPPPPAPRPTETVAAASSSTVDRLLAHLSQELDEGVPGLGERWTGERLPGAPVPAVLEVPLVGKLTLEGGIVRFRDRSTEGEPELTVQELEARLELERVDGRRAGGHLHASVPGLARAVDVELVGTSHARRLDGWLDVRASGLRSRAIEPYLALAGKQLAIERGELRARASFHLERETERGWKGGISLAEAALTGRERELARVGAFSTGFAFVSGERPRLALQGLQIENATVLVERSHDGETLVAGFGARPGGGPILPPSAGPPQEPGFELVAPRVELSRIEIDVDDESGSAPIRTSVGVDARVRDLTIGLPGTASVSARVRVPGLVDDLAFEGRAFTSAVTPALVARVSARGLTSDVARDYLGPLGYEVSLEEKALDARLGIALEPAPAGGFAAVARVSSFTVTDPRGRALALERGEIRVARFDPSAAFAQVPLLELEGPFLAVEQTSRGTTLARSITRLARPDESPSEPVAPIEAVSPGRRHPSLQIEQARLDHGALELVESDGRVTRVEEVRLRAGPLDVGPVDSRRPCDLSIRAKVPHVANDVQVGGILTPPWSGPRVHLAVKASGVDLEALRSRAPNAFSAATVHSGSFRAGIEARLRLLRSGGFTGEVSVRDVSFLDDGGHTLASLGEARARIVRVSPDGKDVDLSAVDIDRPRIEVTRAPTGELLLAGLATRAKVLAFSEEERRRRDRGELPPPSDTPAAGEKRPSGPSGPSAPAASAGAPSSDTTVRIDRFTLASARVGFTDEAVHDPAGHPFRVVITEAEANVENLVLGPTEAPTARGFVGVVLDDGGKATVEGTVSRGPDGLSGWLSVGARGIGVERFTPYSEVSQDVILARGQLALDAAADLKGDRVSGLAKVVLHDLRVRRRSQDPVAGAGTFVVTGVGLTVITDAAGDTTIRLPFSGVLSNPRVGTGAVIGQVFATALVNTLQQPFKLVVKPIEEVTGLSPVRRVLDLIERKKPELEQPQSADALFAPGDARLTIEAAEVAARAARLAQGTRRIISLRACCGRADQSRALRQGELAGDGAGALLVRVEGERRSLVAERQDVAAGERAALEAGDDARAALARSRLTELDARLSRLDRSLDELASRVESPDPTLCRSRAEDALRRLADERVEVLRRALVSSGVDGDRIRIRLARFVDDRNDGRVTVEVAP